jgi:hypothetical protein
MIRKDYLINAVHPSSDDANKINERTKKEILEMLDKAFVMGAVVDLKVIEGVELDNGSKKFSKLRLDIISNTDFDQFS